jgi:hypothetical protein
MNDDECAPSMIESPHDDATQCRNRVQPSRPEPGAVAIAEIADTAVANPNNTTMNQCDFIFCARMTVNKNRRRKTVDHGDDARARNGCGRAINSVFSAAANQ